MMPLVRFGRRSVEGAAILTGRTMLGDKQFGEAAIDTLSVEQIQRLKEDHPRQFRAIVEAATDGMNYD